MMGWLRENQLKLAKWFIWYLFLWNIGLLQAMHYDAMTDKLPAAVRMERQEIVRNFINVRKQVATNKVLNGVPYTPDDYLRDMSEIEAIQKTLKVNVTIQEYATDFRNMMLKGMNVHFGPADLEKARARFDEMERLEREQYDGVRKVTPQFSWLKLLNYLFWLYFKNLLPVFFLYLVWILENKERERRWPSPLHFLWRIAAHPYYLTKVFWCWFATRGREFVAKAELRQTKQKMFVYLSEREEKKIANFVRTQKTLREWRQTLLAEGLKPVHTLAAALIVTLIFTVLPRPVEAKQKFHNNFTLMAVSWQESSTNLARMSIDDHGDSGIWDLERDRFFREEEFELSHFPDVSWLTIFDIPFAFLEVWRDIVHIPLSRLFSSALVSDRYAN